MKIGVYIIYNFDDLFWIFQIKREEKKRKSLEPERNTKLIKLEKPLEQKPKALFHKKSVKIVKRKSSKIEKSVKTESKFSLLVHQEVIDIEDSSDSSNDDVKIMDDFKVEVKEVISNHTKDNSDDSSDIEVITEIEQKNNVSENCIKTDTEISTFTNIKDVTKSDLNCSTVKMNNENIQLKEVVKSDKEFKDLAEVKEISTTYNRDLDSQKELLKNCKENEDVCDTNSAVVIETVTKSEQNGSNVELDKEKGQSKEFEDITEGISAADNNKTEFKSTVIIERNGNGMKESFMNGKDNIDDKTDAIIELN